MAMAAWNTRANEIFLAAIEFVDADARRAHLDEKCGDDAELHRQVEALVAAHEQAGSFLNASPATADSPAEAQTISPRVRSSSERAGVQIGPYKLLESIGEGGMGSVWMAEQREPVRRKVAIKLIKAGMDTAQVIARFEAERQALALMDHPNIARVLDAGQTESGRPYFVMELVKGTPITEYCDQHRLTPAERLALFVQVCRAIQHAHQKGIIHRDLKPSNILVAPFDGRPVVKVIDFGVAKAIGQQLTERTMFTGFGAMVGTLQYMSPEQAELNNQDIDTRSDIYSLGVLLYELLTGSTPLDMNRLRGAAIAAVLMSINQDEPPKPSTRLSESRDSLPSIAAQRHMEPAKLTRILRGDLDWIVMKALSKDRVRRYETANGLARDIERYLANEPVEAGPPSVRYRVRKFVQRNRGPVAAATLIVLALISGVAGTTWQWSRAVQARSSAELSRDETEAARQLAASRAEAEALARAQAEAAREQAEASLYFNRVNLARQYWVNGNAGKTEQLLAECPLPRRGWEWQYLKRLSHDELRRWPGQGAGLSRDRKLAMFVVGQDELAIVDATTWTERRRVRIPRGLTAAGFSPDGMLLVASGTGKRKLVQVFDRSDGTERFRIDNIPGEETLITDVELSPDNQLLVTAGAQPNVVQGGVRAAETIVWDLATREPLYTIAGAGVTTSLSRDGRWLAVYADQVVQVKRDAQGIISASLRVVNLKTGEQRWEAENRIGLPDRGITFSADGRKIASARGKTIVLFDAETGKELRRLDGHTDRVNSLAFSSDGERLLSGGVDQTVGLWNVSDGKLLVSYRGYAGSINGLSFTADGHAFLSGCSDGVIRLRRAESDPEKQVLPKIDDQRRELWWSVALSPDSKTLATLRGGWLTYTLELTDAETDQPMRTFGKGLFAPNMGPGKFRLDFAPDGHSVAGGVLNGTVRIWSVGDGVERLSIKAPDGQLNALRFSTNGGRLLTAGWEEDRQQAVLWDSATGKECWRTTIRNGAERVVFSSDGSLIALGGTGIPRDGLLQPGEATVLDARNGKEVHRLNGHQLPVAGVAFSPDGRWLATASWDRTACLWNLENGQVIHTLRGHTNYVVAVAFSPDGQRVVTASFDHTLKVWDAATGQEILTLPAGQVEELRFSRDGRHLFGIGPVRIQVWDASSVDN
jgi:eukaryotic-like serine/threonine-protein kinase